MPARQAFSLVELVVVVMILGILAAVAVPRLIGTSQTAIDNSIKVSLSVIRDSIERYVAEHEGQLPGDAGTEDDFKADIGPFVQRDFPKSPVGANNDRVAIDTSGSPLSGDANPTHGWKYSNQTGQFICNSSAVTQSDSSVRYDQL